jgi:hypothetical protein
VITPYRVWDHPASTIIPLNRSRGDRRAPDPVVGQSLIGTPFH